MTWYRCYFLDGDDHIKDFCDFDCATDTLAQRESDRLLAEREYEGMELWDGVRRKYWANKAPGA